MDMTHQDIWTIVKENWVPRPGWLSNDRACLAVSSVQLQKNRANVQVERQAGQIAAHENDSGFACKNENLPDRADRRKRKPLSRAGAAPADDRMVRSSAKDGRIDRVSRMGNVIELRPHARDYVYADRILRAICAACEAQAAGEDEIMMARIRELYHLFEDVAG
jgi:hypothetical protein